MRHDRVVKRAGDGAIAERDFMIADLKRSGVIGEVRWHQEGERVNVGKVNHYVADSEVAVAWLH